MFDEQKADRAVSFVKLLRNTQGEYAKHPFNLMPFQEKIVKDISEDEKLNSFWYSK